MVSRICRFLVFWLRKHRTHHSDSQDNYCELPRIDSEETKQGMPLEAFTFGTL